MTQPEHRAFDGDRNPIRPGDGVVPVLLEQEPGKLAVVGTGFYIARYVLFMTAGHVLEALSELDEQKIRPSYVLHHGDGNTCHMRRILTGSLYRMADLAIGQADNYMAKIPDAPLMNRRPILTTTVPDPGTPLVTFAYLENEILDFSDDDTVRVVKSDFFDGEFIRHVRESAHPLMPYSHFETSIRIRSGASGGPVFNSDGRIIGVNCRAAGISVRRMRKRGIYPMSCRSPRRSRCTLRPSSFPIRAGRQVAYLPSA